MTDGTMACLPCIAGYHDECSTLLAGDLDEGLACCCGGRDVLMDLYLEYTGQERSGDGERPAKKKSTSAVDNPGDKLPSGKPRGNSGYIHPDAWPSSQDIGTLTEPESSGRKRQARMYPITVGMVCEWARQKDCGGGVKPIVGCMGNPATDLHHGPDKNTLNNEKASHGIGVQENTHIICSECHNRYHANNDDYYPPYDRVADQTKPWLPYSEQPWGPQSPSPATLEELIEEERRRHEQQQRRGRKHRGRNAGWRGDHDLAVIDDTEEPI